MWRDPQAFALFPVPGDKSGHQVVADKDRRLQPAGIRDRWDCDIPDRLQIGPRQYLDRAAARMRSGDDPASADVDIGEDPVIPRRLAQRQLVGVGLQEPGPGRVLPLAQPDPEPAVRERDQLDPRRRRINLRIAGDLAGRRPKPDQVAFLV